MKRIFVISYIVALISVFANPANADQGSVVAPPDVASYKELSAKWWQWAASTPMSDQGPFGAAGTNCGENQPNGKVFFLAGQFSSVPASRTCDIPAGKWLFFPVINVECSSLEVGTPWYGATVADRRDCVKKPDFAFSGLYATLDGASIVPTSQLNNYLVTSPDFPFIAVFGNAAGIPAGIPESRGFSVSRGVWLLLAPLNPGSYTISFGGRFAGGGSTDASYNITVR